VKPATLRAVGVGAVVSTAATVWLGLWVTPPDRTQGDLVRLLYVHPAIAFVALYLAGGTAAVASLLYLWGRTRSLFWDRLAAASAEIAALFSALTLVTGSLWGRPTWGVWWTWDARLTSTALLLVLLLGYLALRRVPAAPEVRAKRCAAAALIAAVDVPIVHFSVYWWQTLHQGGTVLNPELNVHIHGSMAWTFLLGFVAMCLVFVWMVAMRYRIGVLADRLGGEELEVSLAERRAEGALPSVGAEGALPSVGAEGALPSVGAEGALPSVNAEGALAEVGADRAGPVGPRTPPEPVTPGPTPARSPS
jgi:heme exporter protein C